MITFIYLIDIISFDENGKRIDARLHQAGRDDHRIYYIGHLSRKQIGRNVCIRGGIKPHDCFAGCYYPVVKFAHCTVMDAKNVTRSKKPLIIPALTTTTATVLLLAMFISVLLMEVQMPPQADIKPNITRNGNNFAGFVDIAVPYNISNHSPAAMRDINITLTMTLTSIKNIGWFPDATILQISEIIPDINAFSFIQGTIKINVSSFIAILAVVDAGLVMDVEVTARFQLGPVMIPVHYIYRLQDEWKAPFS